MPNKSSNPAKVKRCPNCGGSDVFYDQYKNKLRCQHCRSEFELELERDLENVATLKGHVVYDGAEKIIDKDVMVTIKCTSCGSELTMNTGEVLSARCPWCRNVLSIENKLPNGTVPDVILPFRVTREGAYEAMKMYMVQHQSLAKQEFVDEFCPENIIGVFLPYMIVDMNVHAEMSGEGEHLVRRYTVGSGDDEETRYDADLYEVDRKFDLLVDDLTIEASSDKLYQNLAVNTNNVVNAIMPFDTENAVKWDARLTTGYVCEKRDVDIKDLDKQVKLQVEDIMRYQMLNSIGLFDRGVRWDKMRLEQKGVKWKTAYMPVWLYSYLDIKDENTAILHYIAINARTGEMVGSSPVNTKKVFWIVGGVPIAFFIIGTLLSIATMSPVLIFFALALFWFIVAGITVGIASSSYRNKAARHMHEKETRASIRNLEVDDVFKKSLKGLSRAQMYDRNDNKMRGILQENAGAFAAVRNRITADGAPQYNPVKNRVVRPPVPKNKDDNTLGVIVALIACVIIMIVFFTFVVKLLMLI